MISIVLDEHGHRSLQVTDSLVMGRIVAALLQRAYEAHMEETRVNLKMVAMYLVFTMVYYGLLWFTMVYFMDFRWILDFRWLC